MGKWLKWISSALGVLLLLLLLAVYFGGRWAVRHYLSRELPAGGGTVRVYAPAFDWDLSLRADSAVFRGPGMDLRTAGVDLSADLFQSFWRFSPSARLRVDTVFVRMAPGPDTVKPRPDSIPFPDLWIPLAARVRLRNVVVRDTAADSLAPVVVAKGLDMRTRGGKKVSLEIDTLRARATGKLAHALRISADWTSQQELRVAASWKRGRDSARVDANLEKSDLLKARAKARVGVASSRPYAAAFGLPPDLPRVRDIVFEADLGVVSRLSADLKLDLRVEDPPRDLPVALSPQKVSLRFDFAGRRGTWSLRSLGDAGTEASFAGTLALASGIPAGSAAAGPSPAAIPISPAPLSPGVPARPAAPLADSSAGSLPSPPPASASFFASSLADSLADPAWVRSNAQVTVSGRLRGFTARVGGAGGANGSEARRLPADLDVEEAVLSFDRIKAAVHTGDGSRLRADLRRAASRSEASPAKAAAAGAARGPAAPTPSRGGPAPAATAGATRAQAAPGRATKARTASPPALPPWNGSFALDLSPRETWMLAFTDTNLAFAQASLEGGIRNGAVRAILRARGLRAYGVSADAVHARLGWSRGVFTLDSSRLTEGGIGWKLAGRVEPGKAGPPASLRVDGGDYDCGSVEAMQHGPGRYEVRARGLLPERLPYRGLDTLRTWHPRVTGDFVWNRIDKIGSTDLKVEAVYGKEPVSARVKAEWDRDLLDVETARAALGADALRASARIRLHGRQFYELKGVVPGDVETAALAADRFDLARALSLAMPDPPLKSGRLSGEIGFSAADGFRGTWRARDLALAGEERPFRIKEVSLAGAGDTVVLRAATASETEPLFRDSVAVYLSGLLAETRGLRVRARAGEHIALGFDGTLAGFRELKGRLTVRGEGDLPGASGSLSDVRIAADLSLPLQGGLAGLALAADTLRATYAVPGLDTQEVSATVRMREGKVEVPRLTLTGRDGARIQGRAEFDPASRKLNADLSGERLSAQFGKDKIQLRELAVRVESDSTRLIVQAAIGSGSAEHIQGALRAAGDFSKVSAYYRLPMGAAGDGRGNAALPLIRVSASLDSSDVRYRIRSMETLTGIFRRQKQRKAANRRAKPMQVDIDIETSGRGNTIETDVLRLAYVGNVSMVGTYPYALVRGRVNSVSGGIGTRRQAYDIKSMEIKWVNAPLEEGELDLNAEKRLARSCDSSTRDSCSIRMNLTGELSDIKFAYDSDCRGGYGTGSADVTALLFSVRRGCYSPSSTGSGDGLTYEEQALSLLDPVASNYLTQGLGFISGKWIQSAQVSGFGALASDRKASAADSTGDAAGDAIGVEILSKEFWRVRFRAKSSYNLQYADQFNPWSYRVGVEWRPPLFRLVDDPEWKKRIKNRITVDASVFTDPSAVAPTANEDQVRRRIGLNYDYEWWGGWWGRAARPDRAAAAADSLP